MAESHERVELEKSLSPANIWAVALGSIIGWGAFIQSPNWMVKAGGPLPLTLGFIIGGLLMLVIGVSYAYMIGKFPVAGGEFAYAYVGFGPVASYVCGWMLSLGYFSIVALNATAVPVLFSILTPGLLQHGFLWTVAGYDVYIGEILVSVALIWIFAYVNIKGVKSAGNMQLILCGLLVSAVVLILVGTFVTGNFHMENLTPAMGYNDVSLISGIIVVVAMAPWLFVGFDCIPQAAEEYNFPANKTFMLIFSAIAIGAFIYAALAVVTASVIPWLEMEQLEVSWRTGAMIQQALGFAGLLFVVIAVLAGMFTGMNGFYMAGSRLIFGMSRARMLPKWFAYIHPVHKTPSHNIIFMAIVCSVAPFVGREALNWVVDMASMGTAFGYFFTAAGAYMVLTKGLMPKSEDDISPVVAASGALIAVIIVLLMCVPGSPAFLSVPCWSALFVWVAMGAIFYAVGMKRFRHTTAGMARYLIIGDKSGLTPAELAAVEECSPIIDCEVDMLEHEMFEKEQK